MIGVAGAFDARRGMIRKSKEVRIILILGVGWIDGGFYFWGIIPNRIKVNAQ